MVDGLMDDEGRLNGMNFSVCQSLFAPCRRILTKEMSSLTSLVLFTCDDRDRFLCIFVHSSDMTPALDFVTTGFHLLMLTPVVLSGDQYQ